MDSYSSKREVEKPKTLAQKRVELLKMAEDTIAALDEQAFAVQRVFGSGSPVLEVIRRTQVLVNRLAAELAK